MRSQTRFTTIIMVITAFIATWILEASRQTAGHHCFLPPLLTWRQATHTLSYMPGRPARESKARDGPPFTLLLLSWACASEDSCPAGLAQSPVLLCSFSWHPQYELTSPVCVPTPFKAYFNNWIQFNKSFTETLLHARHGSRCQQTKNAGCPGGSNLRREDSQPVNYWEHQMWSWLWRKTK